MVFSGNHRFMWFTIDQTYKYLHGGIQINKNLIPMTPISFIVKTFCNTLMQVLHITSVQNRFPPI